MAAETAGSKRGASLAGSARASGRLAADAGEAARRRRSRRSQTSSDARQAELRDIEGLEGDVEAARKEVFAALNAATTLRHAIQHAEEAARAGVARAREAGRRRGRVRIERETRATAERCGGRRRARGAGGASSALASRREPRESGAGDARDRARVERTDLRAREQELAGLDGAPASLTSSRPSAPDTAKPRAMVLAQANGHVGQQGAVADYLEVEPYERAVEACLGDLLQHVIVPAPRTGAGGPALVREENVGRCGFVVARGWRTVAAWTIGRALRRRA